MITRALAGFFMECDRSKYMQFLKTLINMYAEAAGISHSWGNKLAKIAIAISQNAAKVKIAIAKSPNLVKRRLTSIRDRGEYTHQYTAR